MYSFSVCSALHLETSYRVLSLLTRVLCIAILDGSVALHSAKAMPIDEGYRETSVCQCQKMLRGARVRS